MRILFVKDKLAWPRASGHDVHCYQMIRALTGLGHAVSLATVSPPTAEAAQGLDLASAHVLPTGPGDNGHASPLVLTRSQERFRSYWGIPESRIRAVADAADACAADAVVVVGLSVLPYLAGVRRALRVWYAADEWAWHHLSQVRLLDRSTWGEAKQALVKGLYERAYRSLLDRVWVVSEADRRAMRWVAGVRHLDVVPNGVDCAHYCPGDEPQRERSCVFWGRLDFGPNVQALTWFCQKVWPAIRKALPDARFTIFGFQPTPPVEALVRPDLGVSLVPNLPDLRAEVRGQQVVVLPFVSGGGIKNKLLEAASLAKAILCTPRACSGLRVEGDLPLVCASTPGAWIRELTALWADQERRRKLGDQARAWVVERHTWAAAAQTAAAGLKASQAEGGGK